ncbi:MAG: hypothetical protein RIQ89_2017 [Bacteroidota bacterium]|jgi:ubiquinone/menaquinone biosynthesis C-methylase UbiE
MKNYFSSVAPLYDDAFTNTLIGKLQRKQVYHHIKKYLPQMGAHIVELNCGTGTDAHWLMQQGYHIIATDKNEEMAQVAKKKFTTIKFEVADFIAAKKFMSDNTQFIFSNFGGLNCVNSATLQQAFEMYHGVVNDSCKLGIVVMPKYCLWEWCYYQFKGKKHLATRRWKRSGSSFNNQTIWYYNKKEMKKLLPQWQLIKAIPIGLVVPPSYLNPFFKNFPKLLSIFYSLDFFLSQIGLSNFADHSLLIFTKKTNQ